MAGETATGRAEPKKGADAADRTVTSLPVAATWAVAQSRTRAAALAAATARILAMAQNPGGGGQNPGGRRGNGGRGGQIDPEQAERFALFRESMNELQQTGEQYLARILDKGQLTRLRQVQLQLEGPGVVMREDMIDKLNITDEQIEQLQGLRDDRRQMQREIRKQQGDFMKAAFTRVNPGGLANIGPGNGNPGGRGNGNPAGGGNGNPVTGGNGNPVTGGNGNPVTAGPGGGRGNRQRFDPEIMKKVMEDPEVKAQMEKNKADGDKLENQYAAAINKILYPRQRATLKKMLGPPFDRSQMFAGWGGPGGNRGFTKNAAASKTAGTAAKAKTADDDEETASASSAKKGTAPAPAKPSTSARRKSLRESRGSASDE